MLHVKAIDLRAGRASRAAVVAIALVAAAILTVRYFARGESAAAADSPPAAQREAAAVEPDSTEAVVARPDGNRFESGDRSARNDGVAENADSSGIRAFVELREIPDVELVRKDLAQFDGEARDPSWSSQMETQLESALAQTSLTITGAYIECKTSTCIAILLRPSGAYNQTEQVGLPNRAFSVGMFDIAKTLGLIARQPNQVLANNGALVHWQFFFRRCAPDWSCSQ